MSGSVEECQPVLADVTRIRLADLRTLEDSALIHSLRRLVEEAEQPREAFAGFESSF